MVRFFCRYLGRKSNLKFQLAPTKTHTFEVLSEALFEELVAKLPDYKNCSESALHPENCSESRHIVH
jgi:hypothetical protein